MSDRSEFGAWKGVLFIVVIGLVLFFGGFFVARSTSANSVNNDSNQAIGQARYKFMQIEDTVAAIDVHTGETYAIDGSTRTWTLLAPALPKSVAK